MKCHTEKSQQKMTRDLGRSLKTRPVENIEFAKAITWVISTCPTGKKRVNAV